MSAQHEPPTDDTALLEVRDLAVSFAQSRGGAVTPVRRVSFALRPGERVGIVGESGSGKSLTALAVIRLLPASARLSGLVRLNGTTISDLPESELAAIRGAAVGMVFQDPLTSFNPVYPIGAQIAEAIRAHRPVKRATAARQAVELLAQVGIPNAARRTHDYPHRFSGGMRQRAMVAMALAGEPKLLIADEPTTALDVTIQAQVLDLLRNVVTERRMGLLLISHDLDLITAETERTLVMYAGRVVESANAEALTSQPLHPYSASLLRSMPSLEARNERLIAIPGAPPSPGQLPTGCAFHPRCPVGSERAICASADPLLEEYGTGRFAACHFAGEQAPPDQPPAAKPLPRADENSSAERDARRPQVILQANGLVKHYLIRKGLFPGRAQIVHALDGVSLTLARGETLAVVGESGCGKSTLARMLTFLERPTEGTITVEGTEATGAGYRRERQLRRSVQLVFQDPYASLDPRMNVAEIVAEPLRAYGHDRRARAKEVRVLVDLVGLSADSLGRKPHEFSGGQRQRIGIARALALRPAAVVCDEPVSSLDVSVRAQILNLLRDLQQELDLAYVLISHDLRVVNALAARVMVMYVGQIVELGNVEEVFRQPYHPYTGALLDSIVGLDPDASRTVHPAIRGEPTSPISPPSGCRFHSRCWKAAELCTHVTPPLRELTPGRWAACHFPMNIEGSPPGEPPTAHSFEHEATAAKHDKRTLDAP